jgi:hypothetical protein
MRENIFLSSFKLTLKIHFLSESRSVKILFKSIGDNFKNAAYLFNVVYAKKFSQIY